MKSSDIEKTTIVAVYPGRFQPFHLGHARVYRWLAKNFSNTYIATSNSIDLDRKPFSFDDKKAMMVHAGVPEERIVRVKSPYRPEEITSQFDPNRTVLVFAISEKDMKEDPRFSFEPKKDGTPSYFQPLTKNPKRMRDHAYVVTVPTFEFQVLGKTITSASEIRELFKTSDYNTQQQIIKDLYGEYNSDIHQLMKRKLQAVTESDTIITDAVDYHLRNQIPFRTPVFRPGSRRFFEMINHLKSNQLLESSSLDNFDKEILSTDLGEIVTLENGEEVPLDLPFEDETEAKSIKFETLSDGKRLTVRMSVDGTEVGIFSYSLKPVKGEQSNSSEIYPEFRRQGYGSLLLLKTIKTVNDMGKDFREDSKSMTRMQSRIYDNLADAGYIVGGDGYWMITPDGEDFLDTEINQIIQEAEYQGKQVELNKPKRGGAKKFYVYVRNPKTGKVKKIQFGDTGLSVKAHDPDRVRSFVARHKCKTKNDKTTAGYWACRLPRYKNLGIKGGQWW